MFKPLTYLSSFISDEAKSRITHYCVKYSKVEDIKDDKSIFNDTYVSNDMFDDVIDKIKLDIEIKTTSLTDDIVFLLDEIIKNKNDLLVAQADYIVIKKNAFTLVKLENIGKTNKTERCIVFDIQLFRSMLNTEYNEVMNKRTVNLMWTGFVVVWGGIFWYLRKN